jgi:hypothetical protein
LDPESPGLIGLVLYAYDRACLPRLKHVLKI